ncbi:Serine/threonine-protein kinase HT1 [Phytophthora nicotianae]|uniref:Serine/threonine-protein kinase HT1 n=1 Tax=Phytophthora nicotianae TaxID=4792 RepID=A0A0W8DTM7_PHYNI|nr:Serine/threonine-protein kinase HT1 [Phytophthora nicotianae]
MATKQIYRLSPSLSSLLGKSELTRPAAIKEFLPPCFVFTSWNYVKKHDLQDPNDGRMIHPNREMMNVFKVEEIKFTQVMGLVSKHLEKVDQ